MNRLLELLRDLREYEGSRHDAWREIWEAREKETQRSADEKGDIIHDCN